MIRYARKRPDLDYSDLGRGLTACLRPWPEDRATKRITELWSPPGSAVVCLSVRSGLDLYLAAVDWPPGSEVIMSAVTIPQLAVIVRAHGFVPVAVDIDPVTLTVDPRAVAAVITDRSRAMVVAQLFGARTTDDRLISLCRDRGLVLIDDRAECYDGRHRELGSVDVALYSFGLIKTATALGGAVLLVGDRVVRERMIFTLAAQPRQPRAAYALKVIKALVLMVLTEPVVYDRACRLVQRLTGDYDAAIRSISRGFDDRRLLAAIRHRPCRALLTVLAHRLESYDPDRVVRRRRAGERVAARLAPHVEHLGARAAGHTHWLFPVVSAEPETLIAEGRAAGFDLTRGSSTLVSLDARCTDATRAMRDVVYLPVYHPIPTRALDTLADLVNRTEPVVTRADSPL